MSVFKKSIKIPIYFGKLLVIVSEDWDYVNKTYKGELKNTSQACVFEHIDDNDMTTYVVAFTSKNPSEMVVAHESMHLVSLLFKRRGVLFDFDNDEPFAYMLSWFVDSINKILIKAESKDLNP